MINIIEKILIPIFSGMNKKITAHQLPNDRDHKSGLVHLYGYHKIQHSPTGLDKQQQLKFF